MFEIQHIKDYVASELHIDKIFLIKSPYMLKRLG
jgi:hypothetical protein